MSAAGWLARGRGRSATLLVLAVMASCVRAAPATPIAPPPLSPEVAARVEQHLMACDQGSLFDCDILVHVLKDAKHFDEAWAALDHGCGYKGGGVVGQRQPDQTSDRCERYAPGNVCDPGRCARCADPAAQHTPECDRYDHVAEACNDERAQHCPYGELEACLNMSAAQICRSAASLAMSDNLAYGDLENRCDGREVSMWQRALAYRREGCRRFEAASATDPQEESHEHHCGESDIQEELQTCADVQARDAEYAREAQAMQAQMLASIQQSLRDVSAIGTGVAAAKAGLVPVYQPGGPAAPGLSVIYVNPATNRQWTSPGLAFIATRLPRRPRAPAPPPTPVAVAPPPSTTEPNPPPPDPPKPKPETEPEPEAEPEPPYQPGDPSVGTVVGYWNAVTGRVETAVADSAGEIDKKLEYAKEQCRFFVSGKDKDACSPIPSCSKKGFHAAAVGKKKNGRFHVVRACGASKRSVAIKSAIEACSGQAEGCAVADGDTAELRK